MADTNIYLVKEDDKDSDIREFLVKAKSRSQAINHAANIAGFTAEICGAEDAIRLAESGVLDATAE